MANRKQGVPPPVSEERDPPDQAVEASRDGLGVDRVVLFNAYRVVPRDRAFERADSEASEPDWNKGAYLQDPLSGRPVGGWIFNGPPPEFVRQVWREGRALYGVLIAREGQHDP